MKRIFSILMICTILFTMAQGIFAAEETVKVKIPTKEEFMKNEVQKQADGTYLVEGDMELQNLEDVGDYYDKMSQVSTGTKSTMHLSNGNWDKWNDTDKLNLTFCVSDGFGDKKDEVVTAMLEATGVWERYANVEFKYDSSQDANATDGNSNVKFVVRRTTQAEEDNNTSNAAASASLPSYSNKKLRVYNSCYNYSYEQKVRTLTHELGHILGLMHEHIWTLQADGTYKQTSEFEWPSELITALDTASIMYYRNKTGYTGDGTVSRLDVDGIQKVYGNNPARYSVFLKKTTVEEKYLYNVDIKVFLRKHAEYWDQNYRVESVNTIVQNGQIKYSAVFRPSTSNEFGVYGWSRTDFTNKLNEAYKDGWKVYAVDTFEYNGKDHYSATFRPSTVDETWILGYTRDDFISKYNELMANGYRIHKVNTYSLNGAERHTAFFRKSTAAEQGVIGWSRADFINKYNEMSNNGYKLHQVDTYRINGTELYTGFFRAASTSWSWVMGYEFDDYERNYEDSKYPNGYRIAMQSIF